MSVRDPERGGMGIGAGGVSREWRCHSSSPLISLGFSRGDARIRPPSLAGDLAPGVEAHGCEVAWGGAGFPSPASLWLPQMSRRPKAGRRWQWDGPRVPAGEFPFDLVA